MTTLASTVENDPKYKLCLDHGFIGLVDAMPNSPGEGDTAIVQAARVSYGQGTKKTSEDRGLIRYLIRHRHTTPLEMVEFKFHAKMPIFVARQWVRHRTASINEYSGRYSIMSDEFYVPASEDCAPQSSDNKQGRAGTLTDKEIEGVQWLIDVASTSNAEIYKTLLGDYNENQTDVPYGMYDMDGWFDETFPGLARELSRIVLPTNNYTEWYWKCDLHNIFHFISLRMDRHAQKEIRVYANAMYELIKPYVPLACEAFEDYIFKGDNISRMEKELMKNALQKSNTFDNDFESTAKKLGMSPREIREFKDKWGK